MTFETMQYELENNEIDIDSSGTTCTIMIIENGHRLKVSPSTFKIIVQEIGRRFLS